MSNLHREIKPLALSEVFLSLDGGGTVEEIQSKISEVASAVQELGGTGTVTIKLSFKKPAGKGRKVIVTDRVSHTLPTIEKEPTVFFVTDEGDLTRDNPEQLSFEGVR